MTQAVREQLSACLDGELPRAELELLLRRLEQDESLEGVLGRYALVSEALKGDKPAVASRDFAARVMAAVASEPQIAPPRRSLPAVALRGLRPVAGIAVAASVAALALFSVQRLGLTPTTTVAGGPEAVAPVGSTALVDPSYVVPLTSASAAFVPATRLTNYVVAHSEFSSPFWRRSVLTGVLAEDDAEAETAAQPAPTPPAKPQEP